MSPALDYVGALLVLVACLVAVRVLWDNPGATSRSRVAGFSARGLRAG